LNRPRDHSGRIRAVALMGATATGKSDLAVELALEFGGEIISMDSRQVYRGLDIGTGKIGRAARARVAHHLLDIMDPGEHGSAGRHAAMAEAAIRAVATRGRLPILAGGTGLYFRALFSGLVAVTIPRDILGHLRAGFAGKSTAVLHAELAALDAARAAALSANDRVRITRALEIIAYTGTPVSDLYARSRAGAPDIEYLKLVLTMPRPRLRERIAERTRELFAAGWVDEVRRLLDVGVDPSAPAMNSLGYAEIVAALREGRDAADCVERVTTLTRQYAKRQETFFRAEPGAVFIDVTQPGHRDDVRARIEQFIAPEAPQ
jgi:tRNA dimethylallyltransferase